MRRKPLKSGQPGPHAPLGQAAVLRPVVSVQPSRVVDGRHLLAQRRRRAVRPPGTGRLLQAAGLGGLHQREPELPVRPHPFGRLRRQGRDASVRRIHDERRAVAGGPDRFEHRVVGSADIALAPQRRALVPPQHRPALLVERRALLVGKHLDVRELRRPLQRDLVRVVPDALQVGLTPQRAEPARLRLLPGLGRRRGRSLGRQRCDLHTADGRRGAARRGRQVQQSDHRREHRGNADEIDKSSGHCLFPNHSPGPRGGAPLPCGSGTP